MGRYIMLRHKKSQHSKNVISQSVNSKENPIKLPIELFPELNKLILNSALKNKCPRRDKTILKRDKVWANLPGKEN